jgi:hypothetical protein
VNDIQFEVEDRELGFNYRNDRVEGGHFLPFAINKMLEPKAEFDVASLKSRRLFVIPKVIKEMRKGTHSL